MRGAVAAAVVVLLFAGCAGERLDEPGQAGDTDRMVGAPVTFPPSPPVPEGPMEPTIAAELGAIAAAAPLVPAPTVLDLGEAGDPRAAWLLADILAVFAPEGPEAAAARRAASALTGVELEPDGLAWAVLSDHLLAWDMPAYGAYGEHKEALFLLVEPRWEPFFDDADAALDWRQVAWGGVLLDDRELGETGPCRCIPALDDPAVTGAAGGDWYPDERLVFGVVVDGEARAYPKNIMEVHEMVNDTVGGRRIAVPYCTLCGAAQAFLTDPLREDFGEPVFRTTGLLNRSNKISFERTTFSAFDTFAGEAVTGPMRQAGVDLEEVAVRTSTWGDWKAAHPTTTIVAEDGGVGRDYPLDPLGGRDAAGPIFPIGEVDPRLAAQEPVLGVVTDAGVAVAFPVEGAKAALTRGDEVAAQGVTLEIDGSGLLARGAAGEVVPGHEAFWFAWSQFHPDTLLWSAG